MSRTERRTERDWLGDIVKWGERLARHIDGTTFAEFSSDDMTQDAVAKCIEPSGGAATQLMKVNPGIEKQLPELELRQAYAARNRFAHGYYQIKADIAWSTATEAAPRIVATAKEVLDRISRLTDDAADRG